MKSRRLCLMASAALLGLLGTTGGFAHSALATTLSPPTLTKNFSPSTIDVNSNTDLTFTILNPNAVSLTGASFTDTLPDGLVVGAQGVTSNTCALPITAGPGTSVITVSGGLLPPAQTCTIVVSITAVSVGIKVNTTSAITTTEAGPGNPATATLTVVKKMHQHK